MFKRSPWTYVIVELGGELLESQVLMGNIDEEGFEFGERGPLNWRGRCWSIPISCNRFDTRWRVGALPGSPGRGRGSALFWGADESPPGTSRLPGRPRVRYGRACLQAEEEWWLDIGWAAGQRLRRSANVQPSLLSADRARCRKTVTTPQFIKPYRYDTVAIVSPAVGKWATIGEINDRCPLKDTGGWLVMAARGQLCRVGWWGGAQGSLDLLTTQQGRKGALKNTPSSGTTPFCLCQTKEIQTTYSTCCVSTYMHY